MPSKKGKGMAKRGASRIPPEKEAKAYQHPGAESVLRPEVGTQAQFKKRKPPATYRYDSSLSPALEWDGQNPAREQGEAAIKEVIDARTLEQAKTAAAKLKALSRPFLNWTGKPSVFHSTCRHS